MQNTNCQLMDSLKSTYDLDTVLGCLYSRCGHLLIMLTSMYAYGWPHGMLKSCQCLASPALSGNVSLLLIHYSSGFFSDVSLLSYLVQCAVFLTALYSIATYVHLQLLKVATLCECGIVLFLQCLQYQPSGRIKQCITCNIFLE